MPEANAVKKLVRDKYAAIVQSRETEAESSCCDKTTCCSDEETTVAEDYAGLPGYNPDADLGLGCGLPTEFARLSPGDTVLDLGAGAGNDCFVARQVVGETGHVIGVDMTQAMVDKARSNAARLGADNVEFRLGDIEDLPVEPESIDVVVSNCVLNLVPDKAKAFAETWRVLKAGGHFSVSDIVLRSELPAAFKASAELYVGCVAGALQQEDYLAAVAAAGFTNIQVQKERRISVAAGTLAESLTPEETARLNSEEAGIYSITVYAEKPLSAASPAA